MAVGASRVSQYYRDTWTQYRIAWSGEHLHYGYWDSSVRSHRQSLVRMIEVMADRARVRRNDRVLDAGCGVGGASIWIADHIGAAVHGITITPEQIPIAEARARARRVSSLVTFSCLDYQATGFADESFDVVWALESGCYARGADKMDLLREAYRILRHGGRLVMADGFRPGPLSPEQEGIHRAFCDAWAIGELGILPDVVHAAESVGLAMEEVTDITAHVMPSAQRLLRLHRLWTPLVWALPDTLYRNWLGALLQYEMFSSRSGVYVLLLARKP